MRFGEGLLAGEGTLRWILAYEMSLFLRGQYQNEISITESWAISPIWVALKTKSMAAYKLFTQTFMQPQAFTEVIVEAFRVQVIVWVVMDTKDMSYDGFPPCHYKVPIPIAWFCAPVDEAYHRWHPELQHLMFFWRPSRWDFFLETCMRCSGSVMTRKMFTVFILTFSKVPCIKPVFDVWAVLCHEGLDLNVPVCYQDIYLRLCTFNVLQCRLQAFFFS